VALWSGAVASQIEIAVDGCGAAVFGLSLDRMARAYARFGAAVQRGEEIPSRIATAMGTYPFLVGGTDRIDSVIIEETDGRVLAKVGAEGVHSAVILDSGIGLALKVEDGNARAQQPALIRLLQELDALPDPLPPRLEDFLRRPVKNSRGDVVGETKMKVSPARPVRTVSASN
jgi:L-asparaginase II